MLVFYNPENIIKYILCVCVWFFILRFHFFEVEMLKQQQKLLTQEYILEKYKTFFKGPGRNCGLSIIFREEARLKKIREKAISEEVGR